MNKQQIICDIAAHMYYLCRSSSQLQTAEEDLSKALTTGETLRIIAAIRNLYDIADRHMDLMIGSLQDITELSAWLELEDEKDLTVSWKELIQENQTEKTSRYK
ncbi:MAG TPA: hypothetical protein GX717_07825 [Clostridiaceae bacterium]|nr:hypothetical protein [Clostridiaceae bacterium]